MRIRSVFARQVFDSRGMPAVEAEVLLENGVRGVGMSPSGASTGSAEAHEKRDGGTAYMGRGVALAVEGINARISRRLQGMDVSDQTAIDLAMIELDGTSDRSALGGNALIAVSLAAADAGARSADMPLYRWLGGLQGSCLPCPMMNVINGGVHADNDLDIQEFMIVPRGGDSFEARMRMGVECYHALRSLLKRDGLSTAVGDEGGFAPDLKSDRHALDYLVRAIEHAGYRPGQDVYLALDCAAGEWRGESDFLLPKSGMTFTGDALMDHYTGLINGYPIISVEDPFGENDFEAFAALTRAVGKDVMIVGDDLFTTNTTRIEWGIQHGAANAVLIKPNQIGTLTETFDAVKLARRAGYRVILSHRSGETESTAIADIAVAINADYIKSGAPARSERVAKYNRLLRIAEGAGSFTACR